MSQVKPVLRKIPALPPIPSLRIVKPKIVAESAPEIQPPSVFIHSGKQAAYAEFLDLFYGRSR